MTNIVMPAQAGTQDRRSIAPRHASWVPAFAGMTIVVA
jgi:hypothetical protein